MFGRRSGKKLLVIIKPLNIQNVYQQMVDRGLSANTVHHVHWVLHAALRQPEQWEMLVNVPVLAVSGADGDPILLGFIPKLHRIPCLSIKLCVRFVVVCSQRPDAG